MRAALCTKPTWALKKDYDKWDDESEARAKEDLALAKDLATLATINRAKLDANTQISYDLMQQNLEQSIADYQWRYHNYPVNQMFGTHSYGGGIPYQPTPNQHC